MLYAEARAEPGLVLEAQTIRQAVLNGLEGRFRGARVLMLVPDHTRTAPLPSLFPLIATALRDAARLDVMVALGTHPPMALPAIEQLLGIAEARRQGQYRDVGLLNHTYNDTGALADIGVISREQVQAIAGDAWHPSLGGDIPIRINRLVLDYDHLLIVGPVFPHEVVGFSGGAKYLFPGISGRELIDVTHWLGALITILQIIGIKDTPVRRLIHEAAACVPTPVTVMSLVVVPEGLAGLFIGSHLEAWSAAADVSSQRHIHWLDRPYHRVLSCAPPMYDELWTAAKAMYKLEPAVADGGEIIVFAPHLHEISVVHGQHIARAGYHVRDYYLKQWDKFKDIPLGVLAHGTHLRGTGTFENGVERARIRVTLASQIPRDVCERLGLGYADPASIDVASWQARQDDGVLVVPHAGETLYRVRSTG